MAPLPPPPTHQRRLLFRLPLASWEAARTAPSAVASLAARHRACPAAHRRAWPGSPAPPSPSHQPPSPPRYLLLATAAQEVKLSALSVVMAFLLSTTPSTSSWSQIATASPRTLSQQS